MITAILLDYGNVLGYPASGNWFLPPSARKIVGAGNSVRLAANAAKLDVSLAAAKRFLNENGNHRLYDEAEEVAQFTEFFRRIAAGLGVRLNVEICEKLAHEHVYSNAAQLFYPDVLPTIRTLKERYKVGILSDTWPSLRRRLTNAGIMSHLDSLTMSCDYGFTKENPRLFEHAVEAIDEPPESILFVDDMEANLRNARSIGLHAVRMDRGGTVQSSEFTTIRGLDELAAIAASL